MSLEWFFLQNDFICFLGELRGCIFEWWGGGCGTSLFYCHRKYYQYYFFIGNGVDIGLGPKSSYNDFYNYFFENANNENIIKRELLEAKKSGTGARINNGHTE